MKFHFHPFLFFVLIFFVWLLPESCVSDKLDPVDNLLNCDSLGLAYGVEMKSVIDKSCAYSGCHEPGSTIGDFTTYEGMLSRLESGEVEERVLNSGDMPPDFVELETELTAEEIDFFYCWLESGFPEL